MSGRIPLVVEICAGTANFTYGLVGGRNAKFPISRMGNKLGYRQAIYGVLGLHHGQGADAVVLVEADSSLCKAHRLLTTPEGCRAVAAVIRGWIGEDARALWERLRAEPVPDGEAEAVGAWLMASENSAPGGDYFNAQRIGPPGNRRPQDCGTVADRFPALSALRWPPVQVIEGDVVGVEPRDVAAWLWLSGHGDISHPPRLATQYDPEKQGQPGSSWAPPPKDWLACRVGGIHPWPPTIISNADVAAVLPGTLPPGTIAYMDPPYLNTSGYQAKLTRADVLAVARRWSDAGATVCVSEAEPLPLEGWHHVEITGCRVGQKRTFSKQQREWLTLNREPAWVPERQSTLFALEANQ